MTAAHAVRRPRSGRMRGLPAAAFLLLLVALAACDANEDPTSPPAIRTSPEIVGPATPAASPVAPASPVAAEGGSPAASAEPGPTALATIELMPGPEVTAEQVLRFGAGRIANLESVHFRATIEGTVYIDDPRTLQLISAEGNIVRPDRVQTQFRIRIGGQAISTIRMTGIGGQFWMTDIITGEWVPAMTEFNYDPAILFDPDEGLAPVMLGVENPVLVGTEEIRGRDAYVVEATGGKEVIGPITSHTLTGYPVTVRAWIDQETGDLLQIVLIEPPSPENADPSTWTLELSRFNADVTIEPPEIEG